MRPSLESLFWVQSHRDGGWDAPDHGTNVAASRNPAPTPHSLKPSWSLLHLGSAALATERTCHAPLRPVPTYLPSHPHLSNCCATFQAFLLSLQSRELLVGGVSEVPSRGQGDREQGRASLPSHL